MISKYLLLFQIAILIFHLNIFGQESSAFLKYSFLLKVFDERDTMRGSGFVINKNNNYYLVTAAHVVQNGSIYERFYKITYNRSFDNIHILQDSINGSVI